jgi:hypothetical protein
MIDTTYGQYTTLLNNGASRVSEIYDPLRQDFVVMSGVSGGTGFQGMGRVLSAAHPLRHPMMKV